MMKTTTKMNKRSFALLGVAAAATLALTGNPVLAQAAAGSQADAAAPIPLRDFFRSPDRAYYRLSASGQWMSFMQPALGEDGKGLSRIRVTLHETDLARAAYEGPLA